VVDKANIDFYRLFDKSKYRLLSPLRVAAQEAQNGDKRVDKQSIEQNDTAAKNFSMLVVLLPRAPCHSDLSTL
jgi:hypothetical protein